MAAKIDLVEELKKVGIPYTLFWTSTFADYVGQYTDHRSLKFTKVIDGRNF